MVGHTAAGGFVVDSVTTGVTSVPRLNAGQLGLLGAGAGGQWLSDNAPVGATVAVATRLSPRHNDLTQLLSGVDSLVKDGQVYKDPTGTPPSGANPETAVGVSKDGKHAIVVAIDGHGGSGTAFGVTADQAAGYMVAHGAYTAMLFDGGGSTGMVSRSPGAAQAEVVNTPSDLPGNTERPVANGIFFYSTAKEAGPAAEVVVNGGRTVTTVAGGAIPLPVHALDRFSNPASGQVEVRIEPSSLASYEDGKLTAERTGTGRIVASDGRVTASERLDIVAKLQTVAISPDQADLDNGATQQLTLSATVKDGGAVQVPAAAAAWKVTPSDLGTVDAQGVFTADTEHGGLAEVSATVAGATATTSIAVGRVSKVIDPMASTDNWKLSNNTTGKTATLTADPGVSPPDAAAAGSLRLDYTMPAGSGVKQLVLAPRTTLQTTSSNGQVPTGIGLWVKGGGPVGSGNGSLELAEKYLNVDGTANTPLYLTGVTSDGLAPRRRPAAAGLNLPADRQLPRLPGDQPEHRVHRFAQRRRAARAVLAAAGRPARVPRHSRQPVLAAVRGGLRRLRQARHDRARRRRRAHARLRPRVGQQQRHGLRRQAAARPQPAGQAGRRAVPRRHVRRRQARRPAVRQVEDGRPRGARARHRRQPRDHAGLGRRERQLQRQPSATRTTPTVSATRG